MVLQKLWLLGLGWDEPIPGELENLWVSFRDQLEEIELIQIPRWSGATKSSNWQLHGFCDASEKAFAAVLYVVTEGNDVFSPRLLIAKSKIAPIKVVSLPKLELCGATLLARLISFIIPKLDCRPNQIYCWSDSKVVLAWLQSHPSRWKAYVANRVSEIITSVPDAIWRHVRSADNPSDLSSRGCSPSQLRESTIWWSGPDWLAKNSENWPIDPNLNLNTELESRKNEISQVWLVQEKSEFSLWMEKFSSLDKMIGILAVVLRWRAIAKFKEKYVVKNYLTAEEILLGQIVLFKLVQKEAFEKDLADIVARGKVSHTSHLRRLVPFIDKHGLLRVGGRIQSSFLSESEKHPIILPKKHHVTTLLIRKYHLVTHHGGPLLVLSTLLRQFWILHARNTVRSVVRQCVKCARHNANTQQQLMGPLPACRTRPSRPFSITGVDYAGPFWIKTSGGRGQKAFKGYVAVFVCMVIKAVHLEVVSDYSSATFLAAFRRFISRRSSCRVIYSDNGTTFQGANSELVKLFQSTSSFSETVAALLAKDGIEWSFIPPRAPNFGGLWEAGVKSFKKHLIRVVGDTKLTFEELSTVVAQIEACLNSRPLSPFTSNEEDVSALTPGHFLTGGPIVSIPEPYEEVNDSNTVCSRWHLTSLMRNNFWKRWSKEFLSQAQSRTKWLKPRVALKTGDLVLFKDELLPPTKWPLARVIRLHPGADGLCRVATIKTASSEFKRAINKLVLLPISGEASSFYQSVACMAGGISEAAPEEIIKD